MAFRASIFIRQLEMMIRVKNLIAQISNLLIHSNNEFNKEDAEVKKQEIDFAEFFSDFNKSKEIYNELIRKCHPDRFIDPELNAIAAELSLKIAENKSSYSQLVLLKDEAREKLKISI